jgi:hypothetical protein
VQILKLDSAVGVGAQKFDYACAGSCPRCAALGWVSGAVERGAGIVDVDAVKRRCEAVGIALAPHLAVSNDVEPGAPFLGNSRSLVKSAISRRGNSSAMGRDVRKRLGLRRRRFNPSASGEASP